MSHDNQLLYIDKGLYITDKKDNPIIKNELENKCYLLEYDGDRRCYFLSETKNLQLPEVVYGDKSHLNLYLKKYEKQSKNLGVLLTGIKGDGKSVDAKILALNANQPIIIINDGFSGSDFLKFVTNPIFNNCTFFIDEFEKIYSEEDVRFVNILKWLDGISNNKNLFILTSNSLNINKFLINRPSRLRYIKSYAGLPWEITEQVIDAKIEDKDLNNSTKEELSRYPLITMDILIEIINDILDLDITCEEVIKVLNCNLMPETFNGMLELKYKTETTYITISENTLKDLMEDALTGKYRSWLTHKDFKKYNENEDTELYVVLDSFIQTNKEAVKNELYKNKIFDKCFEFKFHGFDFDIKMTLIKSSNTATHLKFF